MKLNDAILMRIEEICNERGSNVCDIALKGGMSPCGDAIFSLRGSDIVSRCEIAIWLPAKPCKVYSTHARQFFLK